MKNRITAQDILDYSNDGAIVVDGQGTVVMLNAAAEQLRRLDSASVAGSDIRSWYISDIYDGVIG